MQKLKIKNYLIRAYYLIIILSFSTACNSKNNTIVNLLKGSTIGAYQKPGAPIDLSYSSTIVANPGDIIDVNLIFSGQLQSNNKIKVSINHDETLELFGFSNPVVFDMSIKNTQPKINLSVYSSELGLTYIHIFVAYYHNNKKISNRVFSVPIKTGKNSIAKLQKTGTIFKNSENKSLIIQEAQTIIR